MCVDRVNLCGGFKGWFGRVCVGRVCVGRVCVGRVCVLIWCVLIGLLDSLSVGKVR